MSWECENITFGGSAAGRGLFAGFYLFVGGIGSGIGIGIGMSFGRMPPHGYLPIILGGGGGGLGLELGGRGLGAAKPRATTKLAASNSQRRL